MHGQPRRTITVAVGGSILPADLTELCDHLCRLLEASPGAVVRCDLREASVDVATVGALARLLLTTRRHGCEMSLSRAPDGLRRLLDVMGLEDVLPPCR